ncbi:beta-3-deoxy-D-manno-oct-2-ulosonic acid transferase [uncultured Sphingomonas sp.]|uniref:capsular polysaccharide export protein, LipB/KpsS family n=1 Tax=uncultured Sphingomonas sp. TaxID=158754 RepID=UPI0035C94698
MSAPGPEAASGPAVDPGKLFALVRAARVGGAFWRVPAGPAPARSAVFAPRDADQRRAMLAEESGREPRGLDGGPPDPGPVARPADPWSLLEGDVVVLADADHEIAALATIAGAPVRLFGEGRFGRGGRVDVAAVVRALVGDVAYRDPFTGTAATIEEAVAVLADWRASIRDNHRIAAMVGIARWKRREVARMTWAPRDRPLRFHADAARAVDAARGAGAVAVWPSREPAALRARARAAGVAVTTVEDGFIRSVGLGSGLHPPYSLAVDESGVHYDPGLASDLERLLETTDPTPALLARAAALRRAIVAGGVAKYGGGARAPLPPRLGDRRLVLVPGQVGDDLSVRLGGVGVDGNLDLLARARAREPDAEIWYRPHPDVDAGHRRGAVSDSAALGYADRVVRGQGMPDLLAQVDGVHVLTSLTGFEALLRGRDVTTHGLPFFAGWGLTRDLGAAPPRRTRRLSLDALVAGTLIRYPRYLDPVTGLPCSVERLVDRVRAAPVPGWSLATWLRAAQGRAVGAIAARRLARG